MLSECKQREAGVLGERASSFINELAQLSRADSVALEVMCLVLLEPRRRTSDADSSLTNALLTQVKNEIREYRLISIAMVHSSQHNERGSGASKTGHVSHILRCTIELLTPC